MRKLARFLAIVTAVMICLSAVSALADVRLVTTAKLNLRAGAGTEYRRIVTIPKGVTVTCGEARQDASGVFWYYTTYNGMSGWVSSQYLSSGGAATGSATTTGEVNMRTGAGLNYKSVGVLKKGVSVTYDAYATDNRNVMWYRVSYNGVRGWVSSKYLKMGGSTPTPTPVAEKITTTGNANLRSGAGLNYSVLTVVKKGTALTYDNALRDGRGVVWYHVNHNGVKGWISSANTTKGGSAPTPVAPKVITTGSVNMRAGAGLNYATLGAIKAGVTMTYDATAVDGRGVVWYHVNYNGTKGWISAAYARVAG